MGYTNTAVQCFLNSMEMRELVLIPWGIPGLQRAWAAPLHAGTLTGIRRPWRKLVAVNLQRRRETISKQYIAMYKHIEVYLHKSFPLVILSELTQILNTLKPVGYYIYTCSNTPKLYILPTRCICAFRLVLTINSNCFPKQQSQSQSQSHITTDIWVGQSVLASGAHLGPVTKFAIWLRFCVRQLLSVML
jgi:hypothetical protein